MAKNKIHAANKDFSHDFQKALNTITNEHWQTGEHPQKGDVITLYALDRLSLTTTDGKHKYKLTARMLTEVIDGYKGGKRIKRVHTREYVYAIYDEQSKPLYEFHWHPEKIDPLTLERRSIRNGEKPPFPSPHIHVKAQDNRFGHLNKKHIPSGRVAFEDVLTFMITEYNVKPRRPDWETILKQTKTKFDKDHSWAIISPTPE